MAVEVYRLELIAETRDQATAGMEAIERRATRLEQIRPTLRVQANTRDADRALNAIVATASRLASTPVTIGVRIADRATSAIGGIVRTLTSPLGLLGAGAGLGALTAWPLKLAGNLEMMQLSYRTFLGGQEKAVAFQQKLERLADISPFQTTDLQRQAVGLLQITHNGDLAIRTMTNMGNAAALTGSGMEGMAAATYQMQQMFAVGRVREGDVNQIASNLRISLPEIRKELGLLAGADMERAGITPVRFLSALNKVLERPAGVRGGVLGGMAEQSKTLLGLVSTMADVVTRNLIRPWGQGLQDEIEPRLASMVGFFDQNREMVSKWGDELRGVARTLSGGLFGAADSVAARVRSLLGSQEWGQGSTGARAGLIWQRLIIEPLDEWWRTNGQRQVGAVSGQIGTAMGGFIGSALATAIGVAQQGGKDPFSEAGAVAATAFGDAFFNSFSASGIGERLMNWLIDDINKSWRSLTFDPSKGLIGSAVRGEGLRFQGRGGPLGGVYDALADNMTGGPQQRADAIATARNQGDAAGAAGDRAPQTIEESRGRVFPVQGYRGASVALHHGQSRGASDVMAPEGTPVVAMEGGVVEDVGSSGPGGNNVTIRGTSGLAYYYAHMRDQIALAPGQKVGPGQRIGAVGRTGNAATTPPHLHIGIGPRIQSGVGPEGGAGADYDAVGALNAALAGPPHPATAAAQLGPAELPYGPYQPDSIGGRALRQADEYAARQGMSAEERKAIRAVLVQEGGAAGNLNNQGSGAAGLWQLYGSAGRPGELNTFAASLGVGLEEARRIAQTRPDLTTAYALGPSGYMRRALEAAREKGITGGAALAQYLQQFGQRSETPEAVVGTYDRLYGRTNALGGVISEPVVGVGLSSGAGYRFAEQRPERVVDTLGAGGGGMHVHGDVNVSLSGADLGSHTGRRAAARALVDDVMREMHDRLSKAAGGVRVAAAGS